MLFLSFEKIFIKNKEKLFAQFKNGGIFAPAKPATVNDH